MPKRWTHDEEAFLLANAASMSRAELAEHFSVSIKSVSDKLRRLKNKRGKGKKKKAEPVVIEDPLDKFGIARKEFITKYIRIIEYNDLSKLIGIKPETLKEAVEKTGIKLPYERARQWSDIDVGKFISYSVCARCFVQIKHNSFIVGTKNCRKCLEKNIKHWVETDTVISIKFKGSE